MAAVGEVPAEGKVKGHSPPATSAQAAARCFARRTPVVWRVRSLLDFALAYQFRRGVECVAQRSGLRKRIAEECLAEVGEIAIVRAAERLRTVEAAVITMVYGSRSGSMNAPAWQADITMTRHLMPDACNASAKAAPVRSRSGNVPVLHRQQRIFRAVRRQCEKQHVLVSRILRCERLERVTQPRHGRERLTLGDRGDR